MHLRELTEAFGVSGYENEVRDLIKKEIEELVDEITIDALGNLIALKKGTGPAHRKVMLAAHMDEVGLQVTKIEKEGLIRAKVLGFLWADMAYMNRIVFRSGLVGVLGGKLAEGKNDIGKLYIDIGTKTRDEAGKHVQVGDIATFIGPYQELPGDIVISKALDDRIGCYILIETIKKIRANQDDLYFAFTVQEEVGCRGGMVAAARIAPDLGLAVDITPAHDYPNDLEGSNEMGGGVAIKVSDMSVICNEAIVQDLTACCKRYGIQYQMDVIDRGGTDSGVINRSGTGVAVAGVSVATRYPHGPSSMLSMKDVEAAISLLDHYLNQQDS
jgi:putative aminopeptidase FrvX